MQKLMSFVMQILGRNCADGAGRGWQQTSMDLGPSGDAHGIYEA
jgi:hypothetical protein